MTRKQSLDVASFAARLAREAEAETPYSIGLIVRDLCAAGRALDRLACADCNGTLTHRQHLRRQRITEEVRLTCAVLGKGFAPVHSGDPRGCVLKLKVPSGKVDDWGHEGLCVPYC